MALIRSFKASIPTTETVARIACPPYDVITTAEARELAKDNAENFMHVIRSEIDLSNDTSPYDPSVYAKARENLLEFEKTGLLTRTAAPTMFIYRLTADGHSQTGIVACCSVDEYDQDKICKHEKTRPDKENDRTQHMLTISAHPEPVFLAYRDDSNVDDIVYNECQKPPLFDFKAGDGVQHTLWQLENTEHLVEMFAEIPQLYVADGHHRSASASRVRAAMREKNPHHKGNEEYNFFPAVVFPASQLSILAYNRILHNVEKWDAKQFIERLKQDFNVQAGASDKPKEQGDVSIYVAGQWYSIKLKSSADHDVVTKLDVSCLQQQLLEPYFGIVDQRTDKRIDFVGGIRGTQTLKQLVDDGKGQLAISLYPTSIDDLFAVSDAGRLMPPKSTWFEPKLRSGLFIHPF